MARVAFDLRHAAVYGGSAGIALLLRPFGLVFVVLGGLFGPILIAFALG